MKSNIFFFIVFLLFFNFIIAQNGELNLDKGIIIPKIICKSDPTQSYSLYLPKDYNIKKKWPILFLFDPAARSMIPMKLFKDAAEKYKYILLCSNNSRNGPSKPIVDAIKAIWIDSHKYLSINPNRIYAAGFSGGARAASRFHYMTKQSCTGLIACGAGLSKIVKPKDIASVNYFGITGMIDFNYYEMKRLKKTLDKAGVNNRFLIFEGTHRWPSKEICMRSVEWMEINAMKDGLRKKDPVIIDAVFNKEFDISQKYEKENKMFQAIENYMAMETLFKGLFDTQKVKFAKEKLLNKSIYKKYVKESVVREKIENRILSKLYKISSYLKNSSKLDLNKIKRQLPIRELKKLKNKNIYDRSAALRIISIFKTDLVQNANFYLRKKNYKQAALYYKIILNIEKKDPLIYYNLACVYALDNKISKAVNALGKAVKNGFKNSEYIKNDKDLNSIKNNKKYKEIILRLQKN